MDKPTCRLCGAKHFAREPHVFGKSEECEGCAQSKLTIAELRARIKTLESVTNVTSNVTNRNHVTKRNRAEYMREYRARK
jgi:hypothetical protein